MDLVSLQFRVFFGRGKADGTAFCVHFDSDLEPTFYLMTKQGSHHLDDVFIRVIIVIPQDDMIARLPLGLVLLPSAFSFDSFDQRLGDR